MKWIITKYLVTAAVVVLVSEFAKRSDRIGGLVAALPMITLSTLVWLYLETNRRPRLANHAWYTFWYVVPTLPMFLWPSPGFCSALDSGGRLAPAH